jgi:hypothetical protein
VLSRGRRRPGQSHPFAETLSGLRLNVETVENSAFRPRTDTLVLIPGNARWFRQSLTALAAMPDNRRPPVVVWHSEPLPYASTAPVPRPRLNAQEIAKIALRDERITDAYSNARYLRQLARVGLPDLLVVTSEDKREYLAELGIEAAVLPLGYHPPRTAPTSRTRDLDVLFLGIVVPRRRRVLRRLRRKGVEVVNLGSWTDPALWGQHRAELLSRVKILLNLSRNPGQFAGTRLTLGMGAGCLVVSEPIYRPEPFVTGEHYVSAPPEELPQTIEWYLAHDGARDRIAAHGHEFVTQQLTLVRSVTQVLALLEKRLGHVS